MPLRCHAFIQLFDDWPWGSNADAMGHCVLVMDHNTVVLGGALLSLQVLCLNKFVG